MVKYRIWYSSFRLVHIASVSCKHDEIGKHLPKSMRIQSKSREGIWPGYALQQVLQRLVFVISGFRLLFENINLRVLVGFVRIDVNDFGKAVVAL